MCKNDVGKGEYRFSSLVKLKKKKSKITLFFTSSEKEFFFIFMM